MPARPKAPPVIRLEEPLDEALEYAEMRVREYQVGLRFFTRHPDEHGSVDVFREKLRIYRTLARAVRIAIRAEKAPYPQTLKPANEETHDRT